MKASEIVMALCDIEEHEKEKELTKGQKSYKTRLQNQLLSHHKQWSKQDLKKAEKELMSLVNAPFKLPKSLRRNNIEYIKALSTEARERLRKIEIIQNRRK